ncbi:MAG: TerB family tellurite resistance protein [Thermodesulfobacteriota bacterium]
MGWFFGASLGWFFGGPLGAVVGAAIQKTLSSNTRHRIEHSQISTNPEAIFVTNLVAIMTKISMADGNISREERAVIHNFFKRSLGYGGEELRFIEAIINETARRDPDLFQVCNAFNRFADHEKRLILLDLAYNVATIDQVITDGEERTINEIVAALGISSDEHERIKVRFSVADKKKGPYTVLGIHQSASNDEIKRAYKQLATQYHPDKVAHLGGELVDFATAKFKEINGSYQTLKKERGF